MAYRTLKNFKEIKGVEYLIDLSELEQYRNPEDKRSYLTKDKRTYKAADGHYCIYPIGKSASQYYIVCPYCGFIHAHGATNGRKRPHCNNKSEQCKRHNLNYLPDYEIV